MSVYFIGKIEIRDENEYQKYLDKCDEIFSKYNGRYLAVDSSPTVLEGSWDWNRTVIIEFPNNDEFLNWYESNEYQKILKYRLKGAICNAALVHSI